MQSVLTGNTKRRVWKGKRRKQHSHSLCTYNEPRAEIKTWLLLSFHIEMSQTRQRKIEGRWKGGRALRGCRALYVNWHNDFVTQDLEIKHFELFHKDKQNQLAQPRYLPPPPSLRPPQSIRLLKRKCSISRLTHSAITECSIHMVIRVCGCECVRAEAAVAVIWHMSAQAVSAARGCIESNTFFTLSLHEGACFFICK